MPGSMPATSQLDWLISTTVMIVLSWSRATRDLLKSFGWGIRALHPLATATMVPSPRRLPHTISPLEGTGFELSVPPGRKAFSRALDRFRRPSVTHRRLAPSRQERSQERFFLKRAQEQAHQAVRCGSAKPSAMRAVGSLTRLSPSSTIRIRPGRFYCHLAQLLRLCRER